MEIRILRKQGKSLRAIAREAGVSVNTVRKYLTDDGAPRYKRRVANVRVHAQTGRIPAEVLTTERACLQALPPPYRGDIRAARATPEASATVTLPARAKVALPAQHVLALYDDLLREAA